MRRTRLSLAVLAVASSAVLGLPTAALADPTATTPASDSAASTAAAERTPTDSTGTGPGSGSGSGSTDDPSASSDAVATGTPAEPNGTDAASTTDSTATAAESAGEAPGTTEAPAGEPAAEAVAAAASPGDIPVQLVAMNDFHGRISLTTGGDSILTTGTGPGPDGIPGNADDGTIVVGGAANVASTVDRLRAAFQAETPNPDGSLFVGAGDLISASPFNSSVFKDEPTIEILNAMHLDVSSVGNHEFDRGTQELRRISAATDGFFSDDVAACDGVTAGVDGCFTDSQGAPFHGADFPYLAANVVMKDSGMPMLPPFEVFDVGGGKQMALIGVVTDTTPTIVSPAGIADVEFIDEATAINQWVPVLQSLGIQSIGVLIHEGGEAGAAAPPAPYDGCVGLTGPITDINAAVSPAVDVIISAHSHQAYNCLLTDPAGQPRLVTQAGFYGRLVTDIRLSVDPLTGDVDRNAAYYTAHNVPVTRNAPDAAVQAIVDYWTAQSAVEGNRIVGQASADILRAGAPPAAATRDAESSLGNLVAQAQLEALKSPTYGDPVIAFMNPGGLRTDILAGDVTYSELFNVQPFGNTVNAVTLTGADVKQVLEEQFQKDQARGTQLILGTSEGFSYSYDPARPFGDRVDACSIALNGAPIDPAGSYRVVANSFLIAGGDSFTGFTHGTDPVTGPVDVDTSVDYFAAHSPVSPPAVGHGTATSNRITCAAPAGGDGGTVSPPPAGGSSTPRGVRNPVGSGSGRSGSGSLAYTGAPVAEMAGLGAALLLSGAVVMTAGYRRRRGLAD
ncbi:MAG: putative 5-nucleotidase [Modestobacter sp.]|nr:putative 5-nucleotidase [Modestobacter sp.]